MNDDIDYESLFGISEDDGGGDGGAGAEGAEGVGAGAEGVGAGAEGAGDGAEGAGAEGAGDGAEGAGAGGAEGAEGAEGAGGAGGAEGAGGAGGAEGAGDGAEGAGAGTGVKGTDAPPTSPAFDREAVVRQAREEYDRQLGATIARLGITDPATGRVISSRAELDAYAELGAAGQRDEFIRRAGMTEDEYKNFVENLPEVRAAREERAAAEAARMKSTVDAQLAEIGKLNPSVKTLDDLTAMPTYGRVYELVKRGNTLVDAYRLANLDALTSDAAASARQAAINSGAGKQHLAPAAQRGTGGATVPAEVAAEYRELMPGITDAEIQRHYNNYAKARG